MGSSSMFSSSRIASLIIDSSTFNPFIGYDETFNLIFLYIFFHS